MSEMPSSSQRGEPRPSSGLVWLTLLSLDAPVVAVLWQRLFARCLDVRVDWWVTSALAIAVWLLYVVDRILDSLRAPARVPEPLRHRFYRAYWRWFLAPVAVALGFEAWLALARLPSHTVSTGLMLGLAVGVYFFSVHFRPRAGESRLPKELVVAVLFAAGTSFPVWQGMGGAHARMIIPLLIFAALCWANCAAIEYSEIEPQAGAKEQLANPAEADGSESEEPGAEDGLHPSTVWIGKHLQAAGLAVGIVALARMVIPWAGAAWPLYAAEALSAAAMIAVARGSGRMRHDLFRVLMDVALFTPAIFLAVLAAR